ncbi:hypothetical protein SLEP1_g31576 [Rubroshorea leprosula]|uniref:Reverse transcriptase domain-containing protein n=1 Tax=Rubroshorea leprosula TaxID=152421 RepID=A0AAV5KB53_9ROSI|nr:hypothetical protein SLEP1_g31576 [Rubroshorea leprosula]
MSSGFLSLTFPSVQENDLLVRSTKKIKNSQEIPRSTATEEVMTDINAQNLSYKDKLLLNGIEGNVDENLSFDAMPDYLEEDSDFDDDPEDPAPIVLFSREDKRRMREPWKKALIIKTFDKTEDLDKVINGGPWFVGAYYLTIRPWEPNFRPEDATFSHTVAWAQLPGLPSEYYDHCSLHKIGNTVGALLRVDAHTAHHTRGQYARICVRVDLDKPLVKTVRLGKIRQKVAYEGIRGLCFSCGRIGHRKSECTFKTTPPSMICDMDTGSKNFQSINEAPSSGDLNSDTLAKSNTSTPAMATLSGKEGSSSTQHIVIPPQGQLNHPDEYGPWLIVDRRKKRSSQKPAMESKSTVEKKTTKGNRDHGEPNHRSGPSNQSVHNGSYAFKANGKVAGALNAKSQFKAVNATVQSKTVVGTRNDKLNPNFLASSSEAKSSQISEEGDAKDSRHINQSKAQLSLGPNAVILEQTSTGSQSPTAQNSSPLEIRSQLWEELRIVSKHFTGPWLVIGDFNDVVDSTEKFGGNPICQNRVKAYTDCMNDCNLLDLGYSGGRFTWVNMRDNSQIIRERIDRAWANPDWRLQFPEANVLHLPRVCSDHNPILLDLEHSGSKSGERPFRLEKFWIDHPDFKDLISPVWSSITSSTTQCVANTKSVCKTWSRNTFGHIFDKKRELNTRLNGIQKALSIKPSTFLSSLEKELSKEYANILKFEEDLWFMKSRTNWVVDGDRNSKFFHLSTIKHRNHNRIHCLRISTDEWVSDQREISNLIVHYFRDLFTSSLAHSYHDSFSLIGGLSSNTMASYVDDDIPSDKEIHDALFSLKPFKAPGPDGLHPMFFQRMWPVVAEILCSDIKNAFCLSSIPEGWNDCLISLIPKINNPETVQQFRPIGLCNTTYKIISKILVNRIKPILESLISPCQASFVPGRKGTDNILILQELVHSFSNKRGKVGDVIVKLDLEKAYDRLEWSFIREALVYFQFPHRVIDLIMSCISTSHITILVNGGKTEKLTPSRGIRQGDPLSPYLFILCMEFLSIKISGDMARGLWKGSKAESSQFFLRSFGSKDQYR